MVIGIEYNQFKHGLNFPKKQHEKSGFELQKKHETSEHFELGHFLPD